MKQDKTRFTRAALLCAAALLAAPAVAQDATVASPPVAAAPAPAPVAPPTVVPTIDASTNVTGGKTSSSTPVNPEAAAQAAAEDAERRAAARTASRPAPRSAPARAAPARTAAPVATAPAPAAVPAPAPAPVAAAPETAPPAPVAQQSVAPVEVTAPADTQADTATTQTTTTSTGGSSMPWIILGVLVLAGVAAAFLFRRRRADAEVYEQPVYAEPVYEPVVAPVAERATVAPIASAAPAVAAVTEPVDVAPALADDATIEKPEAADVAALTAGNRAGDRPWLELAMRPIRAGTNVDEALVEIELTVGNAGSMQAEDVRISTFMLPAGSDSEMDRLLTQSRVDASVEPMTIAAGEGTRVDTTLALSRAELMANDATTFQPVVVADARYRLPDGSEGRTSASFVVGIASDGELGLLELDRPILREDVEARLYREPART